MDIDRDLLTELQSTEPAARNGRPKEGKGSEKDLAARLDRALREMKTLDSDDSDLPGLLFETGSLHSQLGSSAQAQIYLGRALSAARALADGEVIGRSLVALGMVEARDGDSASAMEHFNQALEFASEHRIHGIAWMEIGIINAAAGELAQASDCFDSSLRIFERDGDQLNVLRSQVNIANIRSTEGRYEEALELMLEVMILFEELEQDHHLFESLLIIAGIYQHTGELDTALVYAIRAFFVAQTLGEDCHDATALLTIGDIHRQLGNVREALTALDYALNVAQRIDDMQMQYQIHEILGMVHEAADAPALALSHQKQMIALREEHLRRVGRRSIETMRARVASELKQGEEFRREALQLRNEVAEKQRELTSLALSLVHKGEVLGELKHQLRDLLTTAHERSGEMIEPVLKNLIDNKGPEESWQVFEQQFNTVHRDFMKNLAERYPTLTPMELKLSALMKIDLSTKDIASLLFVTVRNVQNHRYRLRKKFGLLSEANLTLFLAAM